LTRSYRGAIASNMLRTIRDFSVPSGRDEESHEEGMGDSDGFTQQGYGRKYRYPKHDS
jgi:hypothetical protein